jgi:hypothetical protein
MLLSAKSAEQKLAESQQWRRCFAFVPTIVGTNPDGTNIIAFLCFYEKKNGMVRPWEQEVHYRLPGSSNIYTTWE